MNIRWHEVRLEVMCSQGFWNVAAGCLQQLSRHQARMALLTLSDAVLFPQCRQTLLVLLHVKHILTSLFYCCSKSPTAARWTSGQNGQSWSPSPSHPLPSSTSPLQSPRMLLSVDRWSTMTRCMTASRQRLTGHSSGPTRCSRVSQHRMIPSLGELSLLQLNNVLVTLEGVHSLTDACQDLETCTFTKLADFCAGSYLLLLI